MRLNVFYFITLLACAAAYEVNILSEEEFNRPVERNPIKPDELSLQELVSKTMQEIESFMDQLTNIYPEYISLPAEPYTNEELNSYLAQTIVDSLLQYLRSHFDGLRPLDINKLELSSTSNTVQFRISFKEPSLNSTALMDLLQGLTLSAGSKRSEFNLGDLVIQGFIQYMEIFDRIKILYFEAAVAVDGVISDINEFLVSLHEKFDEYYKRMAKVTSHNLSNHLRNHARFYPWYELWEKIKPLINVSRI